jgi:uncharacterized protein (TIGR02270 family)
VTSAIETAVYAQHAVEVAMLWISREVAATDAAYDLSGLRELDERIEANLDGLRLAGDAGWAACTEALGQAESGEIFAASVLAVERGDLSAIARLLDLAAPSAAYTRGQVGALGWVSLEAVKRILPGLLDAECPPKLHYLGIAACSAQREDPGAVLGYAMDSDDAHLRACAYRAAGELGRADLASDLRRAWQDPDAQCRFWASWSAAVLGEPDAVSVLFAIAREGGPFAAAACRTAARKADPGAMNASLQVLGREHPRVALAGAGALGDPALVPWIIECAKTPEIARPAGAALALITGVDLSLSRFRAKPPTGFSSGPNDDPSDENVAMDPDESSPWPAPEVLLTWWSEKARNFPRNTRHISGKPISQDWLEQVLREGSQLVRAAAAEELLVRRHHRVLFEVRAPGFRQSQVLGC